MTLTLPAPARIGSYPNEDVSWLLTDLNGHDLEQDTETREKAIQSGVPYSEMLPVEYRPSPEYVNLYHKVLDQTAETIASHVATVTEMILRDNPEPVLVSLARAGTPIGVLMRRYIKKTRHIDVPHYTISIIRGVGIDTTALEYITTRHPASSIVFVDGWTGKGAISRQLTAAVTRWNETHPDRQLSDTLAVLADPGHCTRMYGTRDDFLIPSACLNSTVSGLVSRTVYKPELIRPDQFHGAKYYQEYTEDDVSNDYVDAITEHFPDSPATPAGIPTPDALDRTPTWIGWETVEKIDQMYSIGDVNKIKPGVGETTRVLLRRIPWKILYNPEQEHHLEHIRILADQRGVPMEPAHWLPFSCVGIIKDVT